jgi:uncharacterized protein (TIGR03435 family)
VKTAGTILLIFGAKIFFLIATAAGISAQSTTLRPTFEVASVRTVEHPERALSRAGMLVRGLRVDIPAMSFAELIALAYSVRSYQVSGPDWIKSQRYIIQAKIPDEASRELVPEMLQSLLADRFHLKLRRETQEHSVYRLVTNPGFELEPLPVDPPGVAPKPASVKMNVNLEFVFAQKLTMLQFADFLSHWADRPVLDATAQTGPFAVALRITIGEAIRTPGATLYVANSSALDATQTRRALERIDEGKKSGDSVLDQVKKMGLRLEPRKAMVDLLVVDLAERTPTAN